MRLIDFGKEPRTNAINFRVLFISHLRLDESANCHLLKGRQVIILIEDMKFFIESLFYLAFVGLSLLLHIIFQI